MSFKTVATLGIGWLLGIVTMLVTPTLVYQRQSIATSPFADNPEFHRALANGWYIIREDNRIYTLERPRIRLP